MKNGKKPVSQRAQRAILPSDFEAEFGNLYTLDEPLKTFLAGKGWEWRFVPYKKLVEQGGYHQRGWLAYSKKTHGGPEQTNQQEFILGADPNGLVRRGTDVLAIRPKEKGDRHRAFLKQEAQKTSNFSQTKADELREMVGNNGRVHEGFEENE